MTRYFKTTLTAAAALLAVTATSAIAQSYPSSTRIKTAKLALLNILLSSKQAG